MGILNFPLINHWSVYCWIICITLSWVYTFWAAFLLPIQGLFGLKVKVVHFSTTCSIHVDVDDQLIGPNDDWHWIRLQPELGANSTVSNNVLQQTVHDDSLATSRLAAKIKSIYKRNRKGMKLCIFTCSANLKKCSSNTASNLSRACDMHCWSLRCKFSEYRVSLTKTEKISGQFMGKNRVGHLLNWFNHLRSASLGVIIIRIDGPRCAVHIFRDFFIVELMDECLEGTFNAVRRRRLAENVTSAAKTLDPRPTKRKMFSQN